MLAAAVASSNALLLRRNFGEGLHSAIAALGETLQLDRVYVLKYQSEKNRLVLLREWVKEGIARLNSCENPFELPKDEFAKVMKRLGAGLVYQSVYTERAGGRDESKEQLKAQSSVSAPIMDEGSLWGCICVDDCQNQTRWGSGELDVLRTVATSIGAAIESDKTEQGFGDQGEQEWVVHQRLMDKLQAERERAMELSKANGALRRSADRLASHPHPTGKAYLDAVLLEASAATGARCASIHQIDATGQWLSQTACTIDNQIVDIETDPRMAIFRQPVDVGQVKGWALTRPGESRWVDIEAERSLLWQFSIPWHQEMGHKTLAMFPLLIGDTHIGLLALCFTTEERPTEPKLELCSTLSQHAALAIELNRLSDEARRAAVQAEQEKAALERAAELSDANAAMQRSTERLSTLNDLDEFVVEALKTVEEVTGAVGSTVFLYDEATRTARAQAVVLEGQVRDFSNDPELLPFRDPMHLAGRQLLTWERVFSSSGYHWSNVDDESNPPDMGAWHRARGHCTIVHFPLRRNTRRIGLLALSFREKFPPVPARLDMVGMLAQQLILAIETARLSEEAQAAATLDERNRIAREIHDTLAQSFTGVLLQLQAVDQSRVSNNPEQTEIHLQNAAAIARKGLAEARRSVKALRPSELDSESLADALKLVARLAEQQSGVAVVVQSDVSARFQPAHAAEILRIVQEAITNAVKHARATLITVSCYDEQGNQLLCITDDGVGFAPERKTEGFGLVGMRERAAKIGGELRVNSGSDGSSICLSIPASGESL